MDRKFKSGSLSEYEQHILFIQKELNRSRRVKANFHKHNAMKHEEAEQFDKKYETMSSLDKA